MGALLAGVAVGFAVSAIAMSPLVMPWRSRVRWLVALQVPDPMLGFAAPPPWNVQAMQLVDVCGDDAHTLLIADETACDRVAGRYLLVAGACPPGLRAKLEGWVAVRTPVLLLRDNAGLHLVGPDGGLPVLERRAASEETSA